MRFLSGFLKFLSFFLMLAGTLVCTAVAVAADELEAYLAMGLALICVLVVALNILGTGIALSCARKNKKKLEQMEQNFQDLKYAYALLQAQTRMPIHNTYVEDNKVQAEPSAAETTGQTAAEQTQPAQPAQPAAFSAEQITIPSMNSSEVQKKTSKKWVPAVIAGVAVLAAVVVVVLVKDDKPKNPTGNLLATEVVMNGNKNEGKGASFADATPVMIGGSIENEYFTMSFDSVEIVDEFSYRTSDISSTSLYVETGYKLLMVRGHFTNNSTRVISENSFYFGAVVNGDFEADDDVRFDFMRSSSFEIDPYTDFDYVMYLNIPEKLAEVFETATFRIGYNEDLSTPTTVFQSDGTRYVDVDTKYTLTSGLTKAQIAHGEEGSAMAAEMKEKALPISIGETISTRDYDFTLRNVELSYEVLPPNTNGVYTSYPAEGGKVFVHVEADVKNTMQRDIRIEELFSTSVVYNDKYPYGGFVIVNDGDNSFDWVESYVAATPLETCRAHGLVECPVEVEETGGSLVVYLQMGDETYTYTLQ